jgi:hypothetical protein
VPSGNCSYSAAFSQKADSTVMDLIGETIEMMRPFSLPAKTGWLYSNDCESQPTRPRIDVQEVCTSH